MECEHEWKEDKQGHFLYCQKCKDTDFDLSLMDVFDLWNSAEAARKQAERELEKWRNWNPDDEELQEMRNQAFPADGGRSVD